MPGKRESRGKERRRPNRDVQPTRLDDARLQYSGAVSGDGGERDGRDLPPDGDTGRPRCAAVRRQCGRCRDCRGGRAVCSGAAKHRDRRRLLYSLFAKGRLAGRAQRFGPRPRQGQGRVVCRARRRRNRRADTACGDGARRDRRLVYLQPRIRHAAPCRIARTGSAGGGRWLCRDPAHRRRLAPQPAEIARSGYCRLVFAGRPAAGRRRQNAQPAARRHLAPDRAGGP